jgi:hypothetical protein
VRGRRSVRGLIGSETVALISCALYTPPTVRCGTATRSGRWFRRSGRFHSARSRHLLAEPPARSAGGGSSGLATSSLTGAFGAASTSSLTADSDSVQPLQTASATAVSAATASAPPVADPSPASPNVAQLIAVVKKSQAAVIAGSRRSTRRRPISTRHKRWLQPTSSITPRCATGSARRAVRHRRTGHRPTHASPPWL